MRAYETKEKREAEAKLPKPLASFFSSQALATLYLGIRDKLKLNLRQVMIMCEVANVTLLGLEPEHALEANLHQYMPELSNADMRELVADLNDRVFKEAQRRLRENIIEPSPTTAQKEESEESKDSEEAVVVPIQKEKRKTEPTIEYDQPPVEPIPKPEVVAPAGPPISVERLAAPTVMKVEKKEVRPEQTGIQKVAVAQPSAPKAYKGVDPYREPIE